MRAGRETLDKMFFNVSLEFYFGEKKNSKFPSKNHAFQWKVGLPKHLFPFHTNIFHWHGIDVSPREFGFRLFRKPFQPCSIQSIKMAFETQACSKVTSAGMESCCQIAFGWVVVPFEVLHGEMGKHLITHSVIQNVAFQIGFREFGHACIAFKLQIATII